MIYRLFIGSTIALIFGFFLGFFNHSVTSQEITIMELITFVWAWRFAEGEITELSRNNKRRKVK